MKAGKAHREIRASRGRTLRVTEVFDTYWKFAAARQRLFHNRISGEPPPWTSDPIIAIHRFTNVYRASDRVSQYLIRHVLYEGSQEPDEVFFRTLLFKMFNRIDTWELFCKKFEMPTWKGFKLESYAKAMDRAIEEGERLYSGAYIMPSPPFGNARKHRNHLELLNRMMKDRIPSRVAGAKSLQDVFKILLQQPSFGDFLAFQFAIDLNYSEIIDFSEMDFVVAGPGARDGISKCFADTGGLTDAEVIEQVTKMADAEFERLGLEFLKLGGTRRLQLIDCQNIFCEVSKYARVAHPEATGASGRTRIKQKFSPNPSPLPQQYPRKWGLRMDPVSVGDGPARETCAQPILSLAPVSTSQLRRREFQRA